jgi:hypothetical protein
MVRGIVRLLLLPIKLLMALVIIVGIIIAIIRVHAAYDQMQPAALMAMQMLAL